MGLDHREVDASAPEGTLARRNEAGTADATIPAHRRSIDRPPHAVAVASFMRFPAFRGLGLVVALLLATGGTEARAQADRESIKPIVASFNLLADRLAEVGFRYSRLTDSYLADSADASVNSLTPTPYVLSARLGSASLPPHTTS